MEDTQPSNLATRYDFEDDAKENTMIEGENTEWTPEYEGGIADFDFDKNTIWDIGEEYLYLGCVKDCGDGNFGLHTFICITPKI
jgi:hypothetical protein